MTAEPQNQRASRGNARTPLLLLQLGILIAQLAILAASAAGVFTNPGTGGAAAALSGLAAYRPLFASLATILLATFVYSVTADRHARARQEREEAELERIRAQYPEVWESVRAAAARAAAAPPSEQHS